MGDGWIGVGLAIDQVRRTVDRLAELRAEYGRDQDPFEVALIVATPPTEADIDRLDVAGVDQIVVRPWTKGSDAVASLTAFASTVGLA
jgi:alkanesulfonate monooxygenase SsuD/methylene tetrahydromethanopterin reductase-like flavin-dependent oxidoreductase (luciferase family)